MCPNPVMDRISKLKKGKSYRTVGVPDPPLYRPGMLLALLFFFREKKHILSWSSRMIILTILKLYVSKTQIIELLFVVIIDYCSYYKI